MCIRDRPCTFPWEFLWLFWLMGNFSFSIFASANIIFWNLADQVCYRMPPVWNFSHFTVSLFWIFTMFYNIIKNKPYIFISIKYGNSTFFTLFVFSNHSLRLAYQELLYHPAASVATWRTCKPCSFALLIFIVNQSLPFPQ